MATNQAAIDAFFKKIKPVDKVPKIHSALLYGPSGTGKSTLAASASLVEELSPVLIVDIEGSASGIGRLFPNVDRIEADTWDKLEFAKQALLNSDHKYKTIIFDTLNVAQTIAQKHFEDIRGGSSFQTWGDLKDWTVDFVRSFHTLPDVLSIFIAHPKTVKDDLTGRVSVSPELSGKAVNDVPTVFDLNGYLGFEDVDGTIKRVLNVGQSNKFVTKNRFGLPDSIIDPDFKKIFAGITAAAESNTKKTTK